MKKIYFLLFTFLTTAFTFGQIMSENFDYGASAGDLTTVSSSVWSNHSGSGAVGYVTSNLTMSGYPSSGVGGSITLTGSAGEDVNRSFAPISSGKVYASALVNISSVSGGNYFMHFNSSSFRTRIGAKDDGNGDVLFGIGTSSSTLTYGTTAFQTGTTYLLVASYEISTGVSNLYVLTAPVASEPTGSEEATNTGSTGTTISAIAFRQSSSIPDINVDGVRVATSWNDIMNDSSEPSLAILTPSEGFTFIPGTTSVNLSIDVQNFNVGATTGGFDGHIHWTINGTAQSMKYDTNDEAIPVTDGQSYTVFMQLVDNGHTPISPAVEATVNFSVATATPVADLAALRADYIANGSGAYYQLASTPTVTYTRTSRNQKYIQDASAGILIDDTAGNITPTFAIGDGMSGLMGQASEFNGVLQFIPVSDATVTTGATITPQVVTISDLLADWEPYESELVQINNTTFVDGGGTFATSTNYDITDPTSSGGGVGPMTFRPFNEADYIGQTIPTGMVPLVALVAEFGGAPQVSARSLTDFTLSTTSFEATAFNVYPNPTSIGFVNISSKTNDTIQVAVFDILGKQVLNNTVNNKRLDVSTLTTGVYIMKISQNGNSITKKLVVR